MVRRLAGAVVCLATGAAFALVPIEGFAFVQPNEHAGCAGFVSAGLSTGAVPGLDREQFEHDIIQFNAQKHGVPPGDIVSRHAQEHSGDFASCFG